VNNINKFAVCINGKYVLLPGVYTVTDASAMVPNRGTPSRAAIIVATARGGNVGAPTIVKRGQVRKLLRGGIGAQMAHVMLDNVGLDFIYFVRVNKATPATLDLGDGTVFSRNPGTPGRSVRVQRSVNAVRADAYDLLVEDASGSGADPERYTNLGVGLDVNYVGSGTVPTMTVTLSDGLTTVALGATGDTDAPYTVTSANAPDLQTLADVLNGTASWSAKVVGNAGTPLSDLNAGAATFTAGLGTLYTSFNAVVTALEASFLLDGVAKVGAKRLTAGYEYLGGGTDGDPAVVADYVDALTVAEQLDAISVSLGSGQGPIVAALQSHVERMSETKARRERIGYTGPNLSTSKADLKTSALALASQCGSSRMVIAGNEVYDADVVTGRDTRYPSFVLAAYAAALKSFNEPAMPLTEKTIGLRLAYTMSPDDDLEPLVGGGVMAAHYDDERGASIITQGLTSYTRDANVMYRKTAGQDIIDYLNKRVRGGLREYIGQVADQTLVNSVYSRVAQILNDETRTQRNRRGVLVAGVDPVTKTPTESWRNLEVVFDGFDLVGVRYDAHPAGEVAYIPVYNSLTPVNIVASA